MNQIQVRAWAKLNLSLDVTGRRDDGYHEMRTIMQSASLYDQLTVTLTDDGSFSASTNRRYLPNDDKNIAVRAARLFLLAAGLPDAGAHIDIRKRIPVCAGLGGGSADAAAVLRALNRLTGAGMTADALRALALQLGADVPYCIEGGTVLATGLGEQLSPLPPLPDCHILICKPPFPISTPVLFRRLDAAPPRHHPDTAGLIAALETGDLSELSRRMFNVFEFALPNRPRGEIRALCSQLLDHGALGAMMTGTGSAVFGLFRSPEKAKQAKAALAPRCEACFLARPLQHYPEDPV